MKQISLIKAGRVAINGEICTHGELVSDGDVVTIDGQVIVKEEKEKVYIAFHKPVGITCTAADRIEDNIIDYINYPERIFPVGRLDKASEGLILLTNDGGIANRILHGRIMSTRRNMLSQSINLLRTGLLMRCPAV